MNLAKLVMRRMGRAFELFGQLLKELSDENAYRRHLLAHDAVHSPQEWRRFCDEKWLAKSRRGRCC